MDRGETAQHNQPSVREYILRRATTNIHKELFPFLPLEKVRSLVEDIHDFQFREALSHVYDNVQIEFSGLGTYKFSGPGAKRELKKLYSKRSVFDNNRGKGTFSEAKLENTERGIQDIEKKIEQYNEFIKTKSSITNNRGMEKLPNALQEIKISH